MPRFAANLSMLFTELPFLDRFEAARQAGFAGVECLFPYDHPEDEVKDALSRAGLPLILINTPAAPAAGRIGQAAIPGAEAGFQADLELALRYAAGLAPKFIHVMAGRSEGAMAERRFCANLEWATKAAPTQHFLIEPLNPHDMPGYFLRDFTTARRVLEQVNAPNLHLQFDAYHAHRISGDVAGLWCEFGDLAAHIQIAGAPGRHEPIPSEIDYSLFFNCLENDRYDGFVSGEYNPTGATIDGLGWMEAPADPPENEKGQRFPPARSLL